MSLVSANKTETNTYTIEISVSPEDFAAAVQQAYLKNRKSIQIPGFRKGKAPKHMIEKLYGADFFYEDALEALFPGEIDNAYKEADIHPVDQPKDFELKHMSAEEGVAFTVKVTVRPEITLSKYKGLEAEKAEVTVTDEEVDAEINRMLERGARIVDVDDRSVQDGDITVIDFEGFVDGVAFEGGKGEKYNLTIGSKTFIPGFEEQIIGHSIGDKFDVNVTFPENYAEELASKDAVFKIELHEIKVKELPELDDEFAKDQDYDTVDEMKAGVRADLEAHKAEHAQADFENAVAEALCDCVEGEIPNVMYDNRAEDAYNEFAQRLKSQGLDIGTYLMYMGTDADGFKASLRDRAVNEVKYDLALEKIVELEGLTAEESEIEEEYTKLAGDYNVDIERIKAALPADMISSQIARRKAAKLVVDSAVAVAPKEKPAEPEAKADDAE